MLRPVVPLVVPIETPPEVELAVVVSGLPEVVPALVLCGAPVEELKLELLPPELEVALVAALGDVPVAETVEMPVTLP